MLLSLGHMLKQGWRLESKPTQGGSEHFLVSPDDTALVPVQYRRNSLALRGTIRAVTQRMDEVQVCKEVLDANPGRWLTTELGSPFIKTFGKHAVDGSAAWGILEISHYLCAYQTGHEQGVNRWWLKELSDHYLELSDKKQVVTEMERGAFTMFMT